MHLLYDRPPSALAYMARALTRGSARKTALTEEKIPLCATWRAHRVEVRQHQRLLDLWGLERTNTLPILYPQVIGFRLNMAVLTHPRFPQPIWSALQTRNRIRQLAPMPADGAFTFDTEASAPRILQKGLEIDLRTTMSADGIALWEGVNTFYYRGRFGVPESRPLDAASPHPPEAVRTHWQGPAPSGWTMARLTGDYNGIHLADTYARLFGFPRAFPHPQVLAGQCLSRIASPTGYPQELDLWLKGQAPYGARLRLQAADGEIGTTFALFAEEQARPIIIGRLRAVQ